MSLTKLLCGSHYNLGCLYEVVLENNVAKSCYLQTQQVHDVATGLSQLLSASDQADGLVLMQTCADNIQLLSFGEGSNSKGAIPFFN